VVANPAVNQGAAIVLTSLERARSMRIDESQLIFVLGGASAMEPRDYLRRDQYERSDAQDVVLNSLRMLAHRNNGELDAMELYSCFPCVPKMTRRVLGLSADVTPTVTGGLSFFGAPLNNYMTHATCAMVRHLRNGRATTGLLYGQGEFITKHHGVAVSRTPPRLQLDADYTVQAQVDARRGVVPPLVTDYSGVATLETHTVFYDRDGAPAKGVVIARTRDGARLMARVDASDSDSIGLLTNDERSPIGASGDVIKEGETLRWRV
jgi:hypothetical protein